MRIQAFKLQKPKRFDYTPRYYDPAKEMREERNRRILRELENESAAATTYRPMDKVDARHYIRFGQKRNARAHRGTILLRLVTVILALTVALLVFYGTWVLVKLV